jgi:hypothetical protein
MEKTEKLFYPTIRLVLIIWILACVVAAIFIPQFDFGFDGVKIWFYLCLMLLVLMLGGRWLFISMQHRI